MPVSKDALKVAIAGANSLQGQDLKQQIESTGFPAGEVRLFDEEPAAGTLTDVGGEAALIQLVDESSFRGARFVFFAGSGEFASQHGPEAVRAGATVIDLTNGLAAHPGAKRWIPRLDAVLTPPPPAPGAGPAAGLCISPSTPAIVTCSLAAALRELKPVRMVMLFFQPVSEQGRKGVEELEGQTVKLLSLQPMPQEVFDSQVAFNLLDRWGPESQGRLATMRERFAAEVRDYLGSRATAPAMHLIQAPVFYGHAFAAYAEFSEPPRLNEFTGRLESVGFRSVGEADPGPSNVGVAGESKAMLSNAMQDPNVAQAVWFWGAADNMRLATSNAVQIAEKMLVS
jgi:aspartate-semialdehyde dehydrogenase